MSTPRILLLKQARDAGLTRPVSKRVPVHQAEELRSTMLADLLRAKVPAALVLVKGSLTDGQVCVHRLPTATRLRPSWDFAKDSIGPAPVIGRRRNSQINFNHA